MLSVSIHVHPSMASAQGCIRYCADSSSFDALEVHCSGAELYVSVLSKRKVLCQFCIRTPEGLFKSFSASTAIDKQLLLPTCVKSDQPIEATSDCDDAQLVSKFSALTTIEKDWDLPTETEIENLTSDSQMNLAEGPKDRSSDVIVDTQLVSKFSALTTTERDLDLPTNTKLENRTDDSQMNWAELPKDGLFAELSFCSELSNPELLDLVAADSCTPATVKDFLMDRIKVGMAFDILCAGCDQILTSEALRFERVEECCEGLTSELSDSWFCHAETTAVGVVMPQSLYFDSVCFYLHGSVMSRLTIQNLDDRRYACGACSSSLTSDSRPVQGFTQFFCDKIQFRHSDSSPEDLSYQFKMAWVTLWGFIESALEISPICKLYLHSKAARGETCLLLWVLPERVSWFLLQASSSTRADFKMEEAYQVSYLISAPSSKTVRTWRYDFDVDFYKVSDSAMSVLVQYLTEASTRLSAKKTPDGFSAAFLPTSFPGTQRFLNKG